MNCWSWDIVLVKKGDYRLDLQIGSLKNDLKLMGLIKIKLLNLGIGHQCFSPKLIIYVFCSNFNFFQFRSNGFPFNENG
jgi:hypothetical protein